MKAIEPAAAASNLENSTWVTLVKPYCRYYSTGKNSGKSRHTKRQSFNLFTPKMKRMTAPICSRTFEVSPSKFPEIQPNIDEDDKPSVTPRSRNYHTMKMEEIESKRFNTNRPFLRGSVS
ncbi:hypothetical protein TNCV_4956581 [Trichonephila clavipes]|nr:hypothetical protein TNCV_4956581 [Trichonephila clavipes]